MVKNYMSSKEKVIASVTKNNGTGDNLFAAGVFHFQCFDSEGKLKWEDTASNLVVRVGAKHMNDTFFSGVSYTAAWYIGLVNDSPSPTFAGTDTLASHAGWTEATQYTGDRKAVTFSAATTADPSVITTASAAQFVMNGTVTINGAFLTDVASGTSGILFSESSFTSPGSRAVVSGDTLNVSYTFNLDQTP
jgi:hypothetical protein